MATRRQCRKFDGDFKQGAVQLVVARELGINGRHGHSPARRSQVVAASQPVTRTPWAEKDGSSGRK